MRVGNRQLSARGSIGDMYPVVYLCPLSSLLNSRGIHYQLPHGIPSVAQSQRTVHEKLGNYCISVHTLVVSWIVISYRDSSGKSRTQYVVQVEARPRRPGATRNSEVEFLKFGFMSPIGCETTENFKAPDLHTLPTTITPPAGPMYVFHHFYCISWLLCCVCCTQDIGNK